MSNKITRECLISPDVVKVAISNNTMFDVGEDGKSIAEVPIPESIKASGIIPEGYAVGELSYLFCLPCLITTMAVLDYYLDPDTVIATLAKNNMTTMESVLRACPLSLYPQVHLNLMFFFRQMPDDLFAKVKEVINAADNVTIAPSFVVEGVSTIMFIFFIY